MLNYTTTNTSDITIEEIDEFIEYMVDNFEDKPPVTYSEFEKLTVDLFDKCFSRLINKGNEYAGHENRFEAFKEAAKGENVIPEEIARRYRLKHDISLKKLLDDIQIGHDESLTEEFINEKIGDIICYTTLIYGMLMERIKK